MNYQQFVDLDGDKRDELIIEFLSKTGDSEHQFYLQRVKKSHKLTLMYTLMEEMGYDKFIPKTLADVLKIESFKL